MQFNVDIKKQARLKDVYLHTYIHTYIHTQDAIQCRYPETSKTQKCLFAYIHTYIHTYIQRMQFNVDIKKQARLKDVYLHTYIHTYVRTYMHTEDAVQCRYQKTSKAQRCLFANALHGKCT